MFDQTPNNNFGGVMGAAPMGGYQYNGYQQPVQKIQNVLTPDEIRELQQQRSQFTLGLTKRESNQAACNHRSVDGTQDTLVFDPIKGTATCTICGYEFRPVDAETTPDVIQEDADRLIDILQTIKLLYTDLPSDASREYFQIIPLIKKIPELFKFAAKNFASHENNTWQYNNANMGGIALLQNLNNLFGASPMGGVPQMGAPMMQPNPQMGFMNQPQQPMGTPGFPQAAYQQPGMNPFGFQGASAMQPGMNPVQQPMGTPVANPSGYQPTTQGFQYNPTQSATPVAPTVTAPAAPTAEAGSSDTTVTQSVTV